jgi:hypothetical protein
MNEDNLLVEFSFVKILVGLEQFNSMQPKDKNEFVVILMKFIVNREAQLDSIKQNLELAKHDLETMRNFHGVQ